MEPGGTNPFFTSAHFSLFLSHAHSLSPLFSSVHLPTAKPSLSFPISYLHPLRQSSLALFLYTSLPFPTSTVIRLRYFLLLIFLPSHTLTHEIQLWSARGAPVPFSIRCRSHQAERIGNVRGYPLFNRLLGLRKRRKLPQQVPGRAPAEIEFCKV